MTDKERIQAAIKSSDAVPRVIIQGAREIIEALGSAGQLPHLTELEQEEIVQKILAKSCIKFCYVIGEAIVANKKKGEA